MPISPTVVSATELSNSFLGNITQICLVTRDHRKMIDRFINLGIGPWTVRTIDHSSLRDTMVRGKPARFSAKLCLANCQNITWEIIEPTGGPSIWAEYLQRHGEDVQHLAFNCNGIDYPKRISEFISRGYTVVQSGVLFGGIEFHYFEAPDAAPPIIEIYNVPSGFSFPAPEAWYPGPPPM